MTFISPGCVFLILSSAHLKYLHIWMSATLSKYSQEFCQLRLIAPTSFFLINKCLLRTFGPLHSSSPPLCLPRLQSVLDSVQIEATVPPRLPTCPEILAVRPPCEAVAPKHPNPQPCPLLLTLAKLDIFRQRLRLPRVCLLLVTKPNFFDSRILCGCPPILPLGHPPNPRGQELSQLPALAMSFPPGSPRTSFSERRPAHR